MTILGAISSGIWNINTQIFTNFYNFVSSFFNSRTAIAGAIIGFLLVFFISSLFLLLPYYVAIASKLLLLIRSYNFN